MRISLKCSTAAAAIVWSGLAAAQIPPKPAPAPAPSGAAGAAPAPSGSFAPPSDPAAPPPAATEPAPVEAVPPPVAPDAAQAATADQDEAAAEPPKKKKRKKKKKKKKRKVRVEEEQYEEEPTPEVDEEEEEEATELRRKPWSLKGKHFIVSGERLTGILTWNQKASVGTVEAEVAGTDVSFLGMGGFDRNPFSIPRVAFDGVFANGFTLGGSISYMVTSGERSSPDEFGGTTKRDTPTESIFLLAPRVGVLFPASPKVGVWLRGGVTRVEGSGESTTTDGFGNVTTRETSVTYVDVTLDPQLVFTPVPHVGITLGAALDIGVTGSTDPAQNSGGTEPDMSASSYGVTAGIAAIF